KRKRMAAKPTGASLATPSVPRKSRSPSAATLADFSGTSSAVATAFSVTPAQATSASSSKSPEQNSTPQPPVARRRPPAGSASAASRSPFAGVGRFLTCPFAFQGEDGRRGAALVALFARGLQGAQRKAFH